MLLVQADDRPTAMRSQGRYTLGTLTALAQLQSLPVGLQLRNSRRIPMVPVCEVIGGQGGWSTAPR